MSHKVTSLCLVSVLFGLGALGAWAQTLDQSCDPIPSSIGYVYLLARERGGSTSPGNEMYQNFVPSATPLVRVDVASWVNGSEDDPSHFRLRILDPTHGELWSQTLPVTAWSGAWTEAGWTEVSFDQPLEVTPGSTYTIAVSGEGYGRFMGWRGGADDDPYPQADPDPTDQIPDDKLLDVDFRFKTYTASNVVTSAADSGPGSLRQAILDASPGDWITFSPDLNGGAIVLTGGELSIDKNLVVRGPGADLLAVDGDGVGRVFLIENGADVQITGLTIQNGQVGLTSDGGGLRVEGIGSRLTVADSAIRDNSARRGGGISAGPNTELVLVRDAIHGNSANGLTGGGGISNDNATVVITTSTISGNSSGARGGALHSSSGYPYLGAVSITSSTIASNTSDSGGGGIYAFGTVEPMTLANTIVADNAPGDCGFNSGSITSDGHNLDSDGSCLFGQATDLPSTDPLLGPLQDNGGPTLTHELQEGSPAIDAGRCAIGEIMDQRGYPRPIDTPGVANVDDGCDLGASESQLAVTTLEDGGPGSLRWVIADAPPGSRIGFVVAGTIHLTSGELVIDKDLTIEGPGAERLTVDGGDVGRVFRVIEGAEVEISGLSVRDGDEGPLCPLPAGSGGPDGT